VGAIRDLGYGCQFFFLQQIGGFLVGGAVNPLISLLTPEVEFAVGFIKILAGGDLQEVFEVPDGPFDSALLIGPPRRAGMDGKGIVSGKVQKLGVEGDFGGSLEDHTFKVIVAMTMGHPANFLKGSDMAVQEELQGVEGIKLGKEVPRVGQQEHESIEYAEGKPPLHPIYLCLFPGQKLQLMEPLGLSPAQRAGVPFDGSIAPREPIGL
jgi:hypothetical protein